MLLVAALAAAALTWNPYPRTARSFDLGTNGLWLGHKWYTGRTVRTGEAITQSDLDQLLATLTTRRVRYAYLHAGPLAEDGSLPDLAGGILGQLLSAAPDVVFLGWLGARVDRFEIDTDSFRAGVTTTLRRLRAEGFAGVHLDLEPLRDGHAGYLALLDRIRAELGSDFIVSQATPRSGPFGVALGPLGRNLWSGSFYRETMRRSDQTVLMAYDTRLPMTSIYVAFVRHQTRLLLDWACDIPGQELLIGVPSYENVPLYSDPEVENIRSASLGVRAALEAESEDAGCFRGVAVYANWVTDETEWQQFEDYWSTPD